MVDKGKKVPRGHSAPEATFARILRFLPEVTWIHKTFYQSQQKDEKNKYLPSTFISTNSPFFPKARQIG